MKEIYFEVVSKMNKRIRVTKSYWKLIVTMKHPVMKGRETNGVGKILVVVGKVA